MKGSLIVVVLIAGIAIGIAASFLGPDYIRPYIPGPLKDKGNAVEGKVTAKQLDADRLLVTVLSKEGATLVTFTKKVSEINLLVGVGDLMTISLREYSPFATDPSIRRVRKDEAGPPETPEAEKAPEKGPEAVPAPGQTAPSNGGGGQKAPDQKPKEEQKI